MKILFIEDDTQFAEGLSQIFSKEKPEWKIFWVNNITDAIAKIETINYFDLVLLDIMIPVDQNIFTVDERKKADTGLSSGIILLDRIIMAQKTKIPILVISAKIDLPEEIRNKEKVSDYLLKPVYIMDVIHTIDYLVNTNKN